MFSVRKLLLCVLPAVLAACASAPKTPDKVPTQLVAFSALPPGEAVPSEWKVWTMSRLRARSRTCWPRTRLTVSRGARSASGLLHQVDVDLRDRPFLFWRWKVMDLAPSDHSPDDSPVRILVNFDGDTSKIPFKDRLFYDEFRLFTGNQLPYAGVMYVWGSKTPVGGIVNNKYTTRIRMIAVESGREKLGKWLEETRNVAEDYRRLFGEEPGRVVPVGIMTEADDGGRALDAYYGDIAFRSTAKR
jgi:hypothetical protein